ncbi:MAG TPA: metalloregulator ArsR/SmtB family transcription factor [Symbiobacteriaceae bacterium]|jgi:ArsR family transcriptional regulator|nr:metalloregulator ArsR/SmtB family transcription factor [Symbiobacteriaceae bacterium]
MVSLDKTALALSDPIRLQILDLLAAGRVDACCSPENPEDPVALCSCDLLAVLDLAPSRLSYHMKELREAGLVSEQKRGRWIYFSLNREALTEFSNALHERFVAQVERPRTSCCSTPLIQLDTTSVDNTSTDKK